MIAKWFSFGIVNQFGGSMGNMLTTVTSNWFEVGDVNVVDALVKLHNVGISDEYTHLEYREDSSGSGPSKIRIAMSDNVNWDKYINHHSIFDLFAMLLTSDAQMVVDEIAYMDGEVAYQHQHQITYTAPKIIQSDLYEKLSNDSLDVVLETLQSIHDQSNNLDQFCTVLGIPLPFLNCFHCEMGTSECFDILTVICGLKDAPHLDVFLLFVSHQMLSKAFQDCGDIDSPSNYKNGKTLLQWVTNDISCVFDDEWEGVDDLLNPTFKKLYAAGNIPQFIYDLWTPSVRGTDFISINLAGVGLTSIPPEIISSNVQGYCLELGANQITDISDAQIEQLVRFEEFYFDDNPIPADRLAAINAKIDELLG